MNRSSYFCFLLLTSGCIQFEEPVFCRNQILDESNAPLDHSDYDAHIVIFKNDLRASPAFLDEMENVEFLPHLMMGIVKNANPSVLETLRENSDVLEVSKDAIFSISFADTMADLSPTEQEASWGVDRVEAPAVWNLGFNGTGIRIGILDTGASADFPDIIHAIAAGRNFTGPDVDDWSDRLGHGTSVAAITSGLADNAFNRGVAPGASLYIAKVFADKGWAADATILRGLEWAMAEKVRVINMSLGSQLITRRISLALDRAYHQGIFIVASAGNDGNPNCLGSNVLFPANHPHVFAVGATNSDDEVDAYSNHGQEIDVVAPGSLIGFWRIAKPSVFGLSYGTSLASPHVAGAAALLLNYDFSLTPDQLFEALKYGAEDFGERGRDNYYGEGILNIRRSLEFLLYR